MPYKQTARIKTEWKCDACGFVQTDDRDSTREEVDQMGAPRKPPGWSMFWGELTELDFFEGQSSGQRDVHYACVDCTSAGVRVRFIMHVMEIEGDGPGPGSKNSLDANSPRAIEFESEKDHVVVSRYRPVKELVETERELPFDPVLAQVVIDYYNDNPGELEKLRRRHDARTEADDRATSTGV